MTTEVIMRVDERGADSRRLRELAEELQADLVVRGVDDARLVRRDDTAVGARGFDPGSLGVLLVSIQGSAQALLQLVESARAWLGRGNRPRAVELTIGEATLTLSDASADQQERLIDEFIRVSSRS
ncbi:hypothetical protein ACQP2F_12645 [Actinoplanes sp. CA-030573]|uniref:hypothetical protein n=1 Tax=Actinoplanes sp. CA-030573 TaxID=3239898 RepID=UPI003D8B2F92